MKFIKSMDIINFQSHKNTHVSFENGLNVISGPSDNGKSAIIRALKWVLYNEPKGTDFVRQGETNCKVSITLSDGKTIIRERTKSKNLYKIIDEYGAESIFEGFGNEIPEEVLRTHGISRLFVDAASSQSINLSEQLEGPFLLSQPGSVKAKAIGRLVGVHIVDEALKEITKELTGMSSEERNLNNNLGYLNEKLKDFEFIQRKKEEIDRKENLLKNITEKNLKLKRTRAWRESFNEVLANIEDVNNIIYSLRELDRAEIIFEELRHNVRNQNQLLLEKGKYLGVCKDINDSKEILEKTQNINAASDIILEVDRLKANMDKLQRHRMKFKAYEEDRVKLSSEISKLMIAERAAERMKDLEVLLEKNKKLSNISDNLNALLDRVKKGEDYISRFRDIQSAETNLIRCNEAFKNLSSFVNLKSKLNGFNDEIGVLRRDITKLERLIEEDVKEYMSLLKEIGKCPVCMSPIEDHTIDLIIKEFDSVK